MIDESDDLPKTGRSADWLAHSDKKRKELKSYRIQKGPMGAVLNTDDPHESMLSEQEQQSRKVGIDLLRKERAEESAEKISKIRSQNRKPGRVAGRQSQR